MPYYPFLKSKSNGLSPDTVKRTAKNIKLLKEQLNAEIPIKDIDTHLLLATWNIRDLGKKGPKHGKRTIEDLFYIAEIISNFDLVAVQEVNDLDEWEKIMDILGKKEWDYIATDISDYANGGNGERMTFVFDRRKVWFKNIAGEIVLSKTKLISENIILENGEQGLEKRQFARTPFLVSFQAGWFKFDLCTVHIYYGEEEGSKLDRRIKEIETIAKEISTRANVSLKNGTQQKHAVIVLGDFNIVHPLHKTMEALKKEKFDIPEKLNNPTNLGNDKYYDQIAIKTNDKTIVEFIDNEDDDANNAGIFELYKTIMKPSDWSMYKNEMQTTTTGKDKTTDKEFENYFNTWKSYHLSDHKPMWIKIPIDKSLYYIENILKS